jgi:hypothetical protein
LRGGDTCIFSPQTDFKTGSTGFAVRIARRQVDSPGIDRPSVFALGGLLSEAAFYDTLDGRL